MYRTHAPLLLAGSLLLTGWLALPTPAHGQQIHAFDWQPARLDCPRLGIRNRQLPVRDGRIEVPVVGVDPSPCQLTLNWRVGRGHFGTALGNEAHSRVSHPSSAVRSYSPNPSILGQPQRQGRLGVTFQTSLAGKQTPFRVYLQVPGEGGRIFYAQPIHVDVVWGRAVAPGMIRGTGPGSGTARPFGWKTAITTQNTNLPVDQELGSASHTIAGHSIQQIVTDGSVRVRPDNRACVQCHGSGVAQAGGWGGAQGATRQSFCAKVDAFENASKPEILKSLFNDWKARNCPD